MDKVNFTIYKYLFEIAHKNKQTLVMFYFKELTDCFSKYCKLDDILLLSEAFELNMIGTVQFLKPTVNRFSKLKKWIKTRKE